MAKVPINKIQKIVVNKSDEVALVVEKMIDSSASELVLSIPRFSKLADSLANFHLMKREGQLLDKKIVIESVDDKVIELAGLAGLDSLNPILSRSRKQFSDIVSSRYIKEDAEEESVKKKKLVELVRKKPEKAIKAPPGDSRIRRWLWLIPVLAVAGILFFVATSILPRAEIKITTVKAAWNYNDSVRAEKLASVDPAAATIPAQTFSQKESIQLSFPATGKKNIEQKAGGKILIYNAYSSDPQPLVATTRFMAPDGKIFRLTKSVTVPGAKISEGKIIPSTLEAEVAADQPGVEYNIGPVSYLSIPGFKGTPKYQAFYGESKESMTGGFIGEAAFPTSDDIKKGKAEIAQKLETSAKEKILSQIPEDFKIIDGASSFSLIKQEVVTDVNSDGNFSVISEASMIIIAFKEADVLAMLEGKIGKEMGADYEIKNSEISYEKARADFNVGRISFPVKFTSTLSKKIDIIALREDIKGKSEPELKLLIYALPDLDSAVISLWPFWVKTVPSSEKKITIIVD